MEVIKGISEVKCSIPHSVVTIGNFDGVHLGHQAIIQLAIKKAHDRNGKCVAYTFRPHPQVALRPGTQVQLLSTYDEKLNLLASLGVDVTVEEPFSREFSTIEPEQFFTDCILRRLNAEVIVVGYDFAFGKERHGHLDALQQFCDRAGVELMVVPPQRVGSEVVSSTRIRQELLSGKIENANRLLGRNFSYQGIVVKGEGRGRKLGFPTANLKLDNKLTLPYGVYATIAMDGHTQYPSVTNVGVRPTFQTGERELPALVETHLLDVNLDLYGSSLEVQFISRIRDEKRFNGIGELKAQIQKDADQAKQQLKMS
jgi:riboflavin kinase/FMN adenylyltransferase